MQSKRCIMPARWMAAHRRWMFGWLIRQKIKKWGKCNRNSVKVLFGSTTAFSHRMKRCRPWIWCCSISCIRMPCHRSATSSRNHQRRFSWIDPVAIIIPHLFPRSPVCSQQSWPTNGSIRYCPCCHRRSQMYDYRRNLIESSLCFAKHDLVAKYWCFGRLFS